MSTLGTGELLLRIAVVAPGCYTERDGGDWYVLAPDHDRMAEDFVDRDDARRFLCWLGGDPLPAGWRVEPHNGGRHYYEIIIPNRSQVATIWTCATKAAFPNFPDLGSRPNARNEIEGEPK